MSVCEVDGAFSFFFIFLSSPFSSLSLTWLKFHKGKMGLGSSCSPYIDHEGDKNKVEGYRENLGGVGSREGCKKKLE